MDDQNSFNFSGNGDGLYPIVKPKMMMISDCEKCGQVVKDYGRNINETMAVGLWILRKYFDRPDATEWLHIERHFKTITWVSATGTGDVPKLRHWGLIESMEGLREDGCRKTGFYKITPKGVAFVDGRIRVMSHYHTYNGEILGYYGKPIYFRDTRWRRFNYRDLMNDML
jgi:hypothetical protein